MNKIVKLTENIEVYNYSKPYIIAEIGANHNGNMDLAKKMVDSAKMCGCDAVKFQSWTPESTESEEEYRRNEIYTDSKKKHFGSLREMVEKYYLKREQHFELKKYCDSIGIDFSSTPFTNEEVDLLNEVGVEYFKVASMDINNSELLSYMASFQKPILLSTGMATLGEIESAIKAIESEGNYKIILLHCISLYPPKEDEINLKNISMLQQTFNYPIGFSDHSIGFSIPLASVALGSCIIEKHFTLDKDLEGWDHEISANPYEMEIIVKESNSICNSLGKYTRVLSEREEKKKLDFRRSVVAKENLEKEHILTKNDFLFKRPGYGIQIGETKYLIGRKLNKDIKKDELINWSDLT